MPRRNKRSGVISDLREMWLSECEKWSPCPRCAGASASFDFESKAGSSISQDFLLGKTKVGLERIRSRLLDLTNRNRLLNFRHTPRSSLSVVGVLPDTLFDTLIEGDSVTFKSVPEPKAAGPRPKVVDHARQIGLPVSVDLPEREISPSCTRRPRRESPDPSLSERSGSDPAAHFVHRQNRNRGVWNQDAASHLWIPRMV